MYVENNFLYNLNKSYQECAAIEIQEDDYSSLIRKIEELTNKESEKNNFIMGIIHELKTPLAVIMSSMQLLSDKIKSYPEMISREEKMMSIMHQNCLRMLKLINNILDFNQIEKYRFNMNCETVNIVYLIEEIIMSVDEFLSSANIKFVFDTEVEEVFIKCDPYYIERIMLNILSNACKYSKHKNAEIKVKITKSLGWINISIEDNGVGIPEDKIDTIFDLYVQNNKDGEKKCTGNGIGLCLSRKLARRMMGELIAIKNRVKGAEFLLKLPALAADVTVKEEEKDFINQKSINLVERFDVVFSEVYTNKNIINKKYSKNNENAS